MIAIPSVFSVFVIVQIAWRNVFAPHAPRWHELSPEHQARLLAAEKERVRDLWRRG